MLAQQHLDGFWQKRVECGTSDVPSAPCALNSVQKVQEAKEGAAGPTEQGQKHKSRWNTNFVRVAGASGMVVARIAGSELS
jgi:hypothetical protein